MVLGYWMACIMRYDCVDCVLSHHASANRPPASPRMYAERAHQQRLQAACPRIILENAKFSAENELPVQCHQARSQEIPPRIDS